MTSGLIPTTFTSPPSDEIAAKLEAAESRGVPSITLAFIFTAALVYGLQQLLIVGLRQSNSGSSDVDHMKFVRRHNAADFLDRNTALYLFYFASVGLVTYAIVFVVELCRITYYDVLEMGSKL
eukprot:TRINITY_DN7168_c0_g1_i1.p1 TRINITY_DN7168_c0_g1~~TRINITY_DN7168_c0_g1_i1.p1  ORF type:complete len:123 (-),score=17.05 TRINITY_DN7168_c0_g1_i1:123-491(-)